MDDDAFFELLLFYSIKNWLIFFFSSLNAPGIGHSILWITCFMILDSVAGANFNLLFSLSTCGYAVGICLFPLLAESLLVAYDWRGVLLIIGSLMFNVVPCVIAIRIPAQRLASGDDVESLHTLSSGTCTSESEGIERNFPFDGGDVIGECEAKHNETGDANEELLHKRNSSRPGLSNRGPTYERADVICENEAENIPGTDKISDKEPLLNAWMGPDFPAILANESSSLGKPSYKNRLESVDDDDGIPSKMKAWLRNTELYGNPVSIFIILSFAIHEIVYVGWHTFLIPHALQRGLSIKQTIILTFSAALGNVSGRIIVGILTHRLVDPISLYLTFTILNIAALLCDAFIPFFYVMLIASLCSGASVAGRATLGPLAVKSRVSPANLAMVVGVMDVFGGCGAIIGGYMAGMLIFP